MRNFDTTMKRYEVEREQDWDSDRRTAPWIKFPADWEVQIIPPFGDAVVRFCVKLPSGMEKSIYQDRRMSLGYWDGPYWEVYPVKGDVGRCDKEDIGTLLELIADETTGEEL